MFDSVDRLRKGSDRQKKAYVAIAELGVFSALSAYSPVLCGTYPIDIDITGSDLDIVMRVDDFGAFSTRVDQLYGKLPGYRMREKEIRGVPSIKVNFAFGGFPFELFGQPVAAVEQYAYLHMVVEAYLLHKHPVIRNEIVRLKEQGMKTEPAFAQVFGLMGDPYETVLALGREMRVI